MTEKMTAVDTVRKQSVTSFWFANPITYMTIFKMTGGELYGRKSEELSKEERKIDEADILYTTYRVFFCHWYPPSKFQVQTS